MPKITHGVIEIFQKDLEWKGLIVIDDIVTLTPIVTGLLFDVDNLDAKKPLAARRGFPSTISLLTRFLRDYDGAPDYFSETWITPKEIRKAFKVTKVTEGWSLVFYLMNILEKQWGTDNVRLVAWFTG